MSFCRASGTVYTAIEVATGHEVTAVNSIHLIKGAYHFSELASLIAQSTDGTHRFSQNKRAASVSKLVILLEQRPFG